MSLQDDPFADMVKYDGACQVCHGDMRKCDGKCWGMLKLPIDPISEAERLNQQLAAKQLSKMFTALPKAEPKPETCPYCGSTELTTHRIPLERTATETFCDNCGESWGKE